MKKIAILCISSAFVVLAFAQKDTFDITTYSSPKDWNKQTAESAVLFSKLDAADSTYCMITLYKAVPGAANSKENFDTAWKFLVKEILSVSAAPEMQPVVTDNSWEAQSGYAAFESGGNKGFVMLITSSNLQKMVNIMILFNSDKYEKEMTDFLESVSINNTGEQPTQIPVTNSDEKSILGNWGNLTGSKINYYDDATGNMIGSGLSKGGGYEFKADGSYTQTFLTTSSHPTYKIFVYTKGTFLVSGNQVTLIATDRHYRKWEYEKLVTDEHSMPVAETFQWEIRPNQYTGKLCLYLLIKGEKQEREFCKE